MLAAADPTAAAAFRVAIAALAVSISPIQGFLVNGEWTTESNLGTIESGDRRFLPCQRTDDDPAGLLRILPR